MCNVVQILIRVTQHVTLTASHKSLFPRARAKILLGCILSRPLALLYRLLILYLMKSTSVKKGYIKFIKTLIFSERAIFMDLEIQICIATD